MQYPESAVAAWGLLSEGFIPMHNLVSKRRTWVRGRSQQYTVAGLITAVG